MAELNARIIAKASATAGEEPVAGDLEVAELAVNTADGKLFTKHTDNSIVTISGGGGGGGATSLNELTDVSAPAPQDDQVLTYVAGPTSAPEGDFVLTGINGTIEDLSVNSFPILDVNTPPVVGIGTGVSNNSIDFSGTTGGLKVDASTHDKFDLQGDYTIEFHIKYVNGGSSAYAIPMGKQRTNSSSTRAWSTVIQSDTGNFVFNSESAPFGPRVDDVWYHVAIVKSGADAVLYKDGVVIANWPGIAVPPVVTSSPLEIGTLRDGDLQSGTFLLDNIRIANTPLYTGPFTPPTDISYTVGPGEWQANSLPNAAATRAILGIGEYADDAAAGSDGVASGAMYYNTTSSDYRLKA